jgi:peptidoglycan/LPS O-acetylase OafA/YrhL
LLSDIARQCEVGVTVFFVISGFLITYLLLVEKEKNGHISLKEFYIRRAFRILPVYFLYILATMVWSHFENLEISKNNLLHALTFTVNFDGSRNWFLGHLWSLSVEEQFYLLWPVTLLLFSRHLKPAVLVIIVFSAIERVLAYKFPSYATVSLAPFFIYSDAIFIGALGGIIFFEKPQLLQYKWVSSPLSKIVALFLFLFFVYSTEHGKLAWVSLPFGRTIIAGCTLVLIAAYIFPSSSFVYRALNSKVLVHIGILSYSIYIWQEFFFVGQIQGIHRTFPFNIIFIYMVSLASYYLWEKPFLNLKKRFAVTSIPSS